MQHAFVHSLSRRLAPLALLVVLTFPQAACAAVAAPESSPTPAFSVQVPAAASDGEAFGVSFSASSAGGVAVQSVTFRFLDRAVTVKALPVKDKPAQLAAMALLPVPLDQKAGLYPLEWQATLSDGSYQSGSASVQVTSKEYPVQQLTLDQKYVTPDPALKTRIARETKQLVAALNTVSPEQYWTLPLARPVPGTLSSVFGLRRVLNGQPRGAHKGLDFRGKSGEPIGALAPGKVVLTGDFYYPGKFVAVDHGLGVVSISMHMSKINVTVGQKVKTGDVLGLIGATGRVTGPHLHLSLSVLGQSVNALPLLKAGPDTWEPKDKDTTP